MLKPVANWYDPGISKLIEPAKNIPLSSILMNG